MSSPVNTVRCKTLKYTKCIFSCCQKVRRLIFFLFVVLYLSSCKLSALNLTIYGSTWVQVSAIILPVIKSLWSEQIFSSPYPYGWWKSAGNHLAGELQHNFQSIREGTKGTWGKELLGDMICPRFFQSHSHLDLSQRNGLATIISPCYLVIILFFTLVLVERKSSQPTAHCRICKLRRWWA